MRQRFFITHDHKGQRNIKIEYTIKSNRDKLTNIMILSDEFLPNLLVKDDDGSILSVMTAHDAKKLIRYFIEKNLNEPQQKLEQLYSKIISEELHMIWIKIPKSKSFDKNETRTFTMNYSPHLNQPESIDKILIKKQPYPLYYTLFSPDEFDFAQIRYGLIQKDGKIRHGDKQPECIQKFKTHNSNVFRIISPQEKSFEVLYSFKPASISATPTKIGLGTLIGLSSITALFKYAVILGIISDIDLLSRHIEIGLFVIGGSLLLPQLTNNQSIRARYTKWYLVSIIIGIIILL